MRQAYIQLSEIFGTSTTPLFVRHDDIRVIEPYDEGSIIVVTKAYSVAEKPETILRMLEASVIAENDGDITVKSYRHPV